jgi:hypothetical protein
MLALLACSIGLCVGLRLNVLALLPVSVLGSGAYILVYWYAGSSPPHSAGQLIPALIAIQLGYFLGLTARESYRHLLVRLKTGQSWRAR